MEYITQENETKIYMNGERKMLYIAVKWKDGTVTHRTYNDPHVLERQYTETEIREILNISILRSNKFTFVDFLYKTKFIMIHKGS